MFFWIPLQKNLISTNFSKEQVHLNSDLGLNKLFILQNNWKKKTLLILLSIFQMSWSLERQKPKIWSLKC